MVMRWAYAVTTVPSRKTDLLPTTLKSLADAGFDKPRLFIDGATKGYEQFGCEVTYRDTPLKTYGNWVLALAETYIRNPSAKRYAIFQDDLVAAAGLRTYLEKWYPDRGYLNLYTFPQNESMRFAQLLTLNIEDKNHRQQRIDALSVLPLTELHDLVSQVSKEELDRLTRPGWWPSNQMGKGAVGLVFDRFAVQALLCHQHMVERPVDATRGWRNVDGAIISAMTKAGFTEYIHSPSLVQHAGEVSSMGNGRYPVAPYFTGQVS